MVTRVIIFLVLNFGALAVGSYFTGKGVPSEWYLNLNKAPWTPPGWMFGLAWTTIMIFFSVYMAKLWPEAENSSFLITLFILQWLLNVSWNPVFFYFHDVVIGFLIISVLTILMLFLMVHYWSDITMYSLFVLPYVVWLVVATSLNAYIVVRN